MTWTHAALFALLLPACATAGRAPATPAAPVATMKGVGNRCPEGVCSCRPVDQRGASLDPQFDEGAPAEGTKRFELRTGRGLDPMTVTVEGLGSFEKATSSPESSCGYVDLPPGKHRITLHARAANPEQGFEPALFVYEHGAQTHSWYDTFQFRCGGGASLCTIGHMQQFLAEAQRVARGLWDPCGSVRVEGVKWDGGRSAGANLVELTVELVLNVYKFEPRFPHGTARCKGPSPEPEP